MLNFLASPHRWSMFFLECFEPALEPPEAVGYLIFRRDAKEGSCDIAVSQVIQNKEAISWSAFKAKIKGNFELLLLVSISLAMYFLSNLFTKISMTDR